MKLNSKQLIKEIKDGKNLEVNLPDFAARQAGVYYKKAMIDLSFNYYTLYEMYYEKENKELGHLKSWIDQINDIIQTSLLSEFDGSVREDSIRQLSSIREEIIKNLNVLTYYTDTFILYEYVLNRIEGRYKEIPCDIEDEAFVEKIIRYIFDTRDNVIINDKIKEIIGQLPVRMAKSKYFELVKNSISIYRGADRSAVEDYLYMLKTSAGLYEPEGVTALYPELAAFLEQLLAADYSDLREEEYGRLSEQLKSHAGFLWERTDSFVALQEIVNYLYAVVLLQPYVSEDKEEDGRIGKSILQTILPLYAEGNQEVPEATEHLLMLLEGRPEQLNQKIDILEGALYDIVFQYRDLLEGMMQEKVYHCLLISQKLMSSSMFMDLEDPKESEKAEDNYITEVSEQLINELNSYFKKNHRMVNRAVIANTINKMPVFFVDSDEVVKYISAALTQCSDEAEKRACKSIINELIEEYNDFFDE